MQVANSYPTRMFLVGPMGVGKTTIGKILARELGLEFVDCDHEIERRSGADIPWIFDVEGEDGFRARETAVLADLTNQDGLLVATGGGAVLREENRGYLRTRGIVVFLDSDVDLLVKRTAKDKKRPLLQNNDPRKVLTRIKQEREPFYREVSDVHVLVPDDGGRKAVTLILDKLQGEGFIE